ncbi:MAG: ankyrin [Rickettsiaceae bacterium]|jgi:ankyrin repeat protein|nr:ankyrin [Rickettsiaceae bacterium]
MKEKQIGAQILLASGTARFSGKPGWLDKFLGEKDEHKIIIGEKYIDPKSKEFQELCQNAYDNFKEKYGDESKRKLQRVERKYNKLLREAEVKDGIKWMSVFVSNLGLTTQVRSALTPQNNLGNKPEETKVELGPESNIATAVTAEEPTLPESQGTIEAGEFLKSPSIFEEVKEESHVASYADSAAQTIGDAMNWMSARAGGIAYGMLIFGASVAGNSAAAKVFTVATLPSLATVEARKRGKIANGITVYCGPQIHCGYLREEAKKKKIELIEFDQKQLLNKIHDSTETLIIDAHSDESGIQTIETDLGGQADEVAAQFFLNLRFIDAFGCYLGKNPKQNFGENSLRPGQFLFLHAGSEAVSGVATRQIISFLSLKPNLGFPYANPLHIVFKQDAVNSIFTELLPLPLPKIASAIRNNAGINELYDLIATHVTRQKTSALKKLPVNKEDLAAKLEKLGYRDFAVDTDITEKEKMVQDYLCQSCHSVVAYEDISPSSLKDFRAIIESGLININHTFSDGETISCTAAGMGHYKYLEILLENKADLDIARYDGATPLLMASQNGHYECVKILLTKKTDPNKARNDGITPLLMASQHGHHECVKALLEHKDNPKTDPNKATNDGRTPLFIAAEFGHHECVKALLEHKDNPKTDPNKARNDGKTPLLRAVELGHHECTKILLKYKINTNKVTDKGDTPLLSAIVRYHKDPNPDNKKTIILLIKSGADPELMTKRGTAYRLAHRIADQDPALVKDMQKARNEYLKDPESKPSGKAKKPKSAKLEKSKEKEL